ncbi:MAG: hypothetical protein AAGI34_20160 [Pseudomonadota bacterium]
MAHPLHHAESSARKFGGVAEDYQALHDWIDGSKAFYSGYTHRALRHHAQGCFEAERLFGTAITNAAGRQVPVRFIAEQHIKEDCGGRIPSLQDWFSRIQAEPWMSKGHLEQGAAEEAALTPLSPERWRAEVAEGRTILGYLDWCRRYAGCSGGRHEER